jgi:small subunit ribosomal protein S1
MNQPGESRPDEPGELDMEALLREEEEAARQFRRGEVIEGTVIAVDREGIIVDVGSKSEGLVPNHEMQSLGVNPASQLKPGDPILVSIVAPETPEGQILLSIDRARGERGWRLLQQYLDQGESFDGLIVGFNKGGLLANVEGVHAFVPLSQVVGVRADRDDESGKALASAVGKTLRLKVIELNRRRNRVILSERSALQEWRTQQKDRLLAELREGEVRRGKVTSIRDFGVFVDLGGADGLAHLSELSWERNRRPEELFQVGDEVDAFILKIDPETKKIALSLRRAAPEQWETLVDRFQPGEVVVGRITKLVAFGAFARLDGPVEGLVHISELTDRRLSHPNEVVHEGDIVPLKVVRIERDRRRLGLSLRQAVAEGEQMGFVFANDGRIRRVPAEILARFGVTPPPDEDEPQDEESPGAVMAEAPAETAPDSPESRTGPPPERPAPPPEQPEDETAVAAALRAAGVLDLPGDDADMSSGDAPEEGGVTGPRAEN